MLLFVLVPITRFSDGPDFSDHHLPITGSPDLKALVAAPPRCTNQWAGLMAHAGSSVSSVVRFLVVARPGCTD